ncbi:MAG TPA: acyl-CoA dehydrogenase family protein [bacterium]|nr:acyl-CoA dehydrogenase family protein [bacterium]
MKRNLFSEEHRIFRDSFRKFLEKEIVPYHEQWEKDGIVDREAWLKAGEQGFLCPWVSEDYGGLGVDFLYSVIMAEECAKARVTGFLMQLHSDIVVPYLNSFGSGEQKKKWLPGCVSGACLTALAMTEPGTGSDVSAIKTTAVRDGDSYIINGQKTFISNGILSDIVIVAAITNQKADPPHTGISLIVVERDTPGFIRGRKLEKMGMKAQDTAEMFFEDCRVPATNLLGDEGMGFIYMMQKLQQERLICAVGSQAAAELMLSDVVKYTKERTAFGRPISKFQNTRFKLAEMATEIELGRVFLDRLIEEHAAGADVVTETSMAKWWVCEMAKRTADQALQFYGGYGYMMEYPICKDYMDIRVQTIFAGTTEIMKEIIGRRMGL